MLLAGAGCERRAERVRERVALRLQALDFGLAEAGERDAYEQIGAEARPVAVGPVRRVVGRGRVCKKGALAVELGPEAAAADPASLVVAVRARRDGGPEDEVLMGAALVHFVRLEGGWSLVRRGSATVLRLPSELCEGTSSADVRVERLVPGPARAESRPFAIPKGSRLELGFGAVDAPASGSEAALALRATLHCAGERARRLVQARLDGRAARRGWSDAVARFPRGHSSCRLVLETSGAGPIRDRAVWTVPRLLAPVGADEPEARAPSLVLISADTLRGDHLSGLGYPRPTSPAIDREMISRGTAFSDVSTTFPLTSVAHLSLFTSLYPGAHPPRGRIGRRTPLVTLAEALRDAGLETAAFTEDALLTGASGFWAGFDRWTERALAPGERGWLTFDEGARYLRRHRDGRFFLFLHTYQVHAPYASDGAYADLFAGEPPTASAVPRNDWDGVDAYDRAIRELDDQVRLFLHELHELGLEHRTVVALVADHGEAFGEHGARGHGMDGHQEQLHIPWILRGPGIPAGRRIEAPLSIVDVAPTLLDLLGVDPPPGLQGRSAAAAVAGEGSAPSRPIHFAWIGNRARGVRHGRWKLLRSSGGDRLYDLRADPGERHPLSAAAERPEPRMIEVQEARDEARRRALARAGEEAPARAVAPAVRRQLRALGYLAGPAD